MSRTDSFTLGIDVSVRDSGRLEATPKITIEGPAGSFTTDGLIITARHIHTNPADEANAAGIEVAATGELVQV